VWGSVAGENGDDVVVEVNDSGIGIPSDSLRGIFNAFEQAETSIGKHFGEAGRWMFGLQGDGRC
jgi:signal transduction histidine kinase